MKKTLAIVVFVLFAVAWAGAQHDIGFKGFGAKIGIVMPDDVDNTVGFGLFADLGSFEKFQLQAYLDYWSQEYTRDNKWDWRWSVISLAAIGTYEFDLHSSIKPYVGAGLGFDISSWKSEFRRSDSSAELEDEPRSSETDFDLALHLIGGASYAFSPTLEGFAEIKFATGGIDYFGVYVGVVYKIR